MNEFNQNNVSGESGEINTQNNNQETTPVAETHTKEMPQAPKEKSTGPLIGIIIIVVVLILGGLYFWGKQVRTAIQEPQTEPQTIVEDASLDALQNQGDSIDITDIENDLNATDLGGLDDELQDIDLELVF